jgi:hypothetical protein
MPQTQLKMRLQPVEQERRGGVSSRRHWTGYSRKPSFKAVRGLWLSRGQAVSRRDGYLIVNLNAQIKAIPFVEAGKTAHQGISKSGTT